MNFKNIFTILFDEITIIYILLIYKIYSILQYLMKNYEKHKFSYKFEMREDEKKIDR